MVAVFWRAVFSIISIIGAFLVIIGLISIPIISLIAAFLVFVGVIGLYFASIQAQKIIPFKQPIRIATATIEFIISSNIEPNATSTERYMGFGLRVSFKKNNTNLMILEDPDFFETEDYRKLIYNANLSMNVSESAIGSLIYSLKETELITIEFGDLPSRISGSSVLSGKIICTVNSIVQFVIPIHPQEITNDIIFVRELTSFIAQFP